MIKDPNGMKVSPRQKAAEILLERLPSHTGLEAHQSEDMTEREIALVNRQMEKLHNKMYKSLLKARKEDKDDNQED